MSQRPKASPRRRAKAKERHVPRTPATATTTIAGRMKGPTPVGGPGRKHTQEEVPLLGIPRRGGLVAEENLQTSFACASEPKFRVCECILSY